MLADSRLPCRFLAEALLTMVCVRNRSPTKAPAGTTPHEAWSSVKPNVDHFHIFGCSGYVHIPAAERHKVEPKSRKLGYGTEQN